MIDVQVTGSRNATSSFLAESRARVVSEGETFNLIQAIYLAVSRSGTYWCPWTSCPFHSYCCKLNAEEELTTNTVGLDSKFDSRVRQEASWCQTPSFYNVCYWIVMKPDSSDCKTEQPFNKITTWTFVLWKSIFPIRHDGVTTVTVSGFGNSTPQKLANSTHHNLNDYQEKKSTCYITPRLIL